MRIGLGAASFARGSIDDAVKQIGQASQLDPLNSAPYLFLGKILNVDNAPSPELVDCLQRFATLQPQNAEANYYYAVALWKQKRAAPNIVPDAHIESLLENALRHDPNFAPAELQLGILKAERGDYSGAIPHYTRAIDISPQLEEAHYRLAQAYRRAGETEKAKDELRKYNELSKQFALQIDRERREIRQFVYTLRDPQPPQNP
jgi:tetratricopeptide (TPR) repeat protein